MEIESALTEPGFEQLCQSLPQVEQFSPGPAPGGEFARLRLRSGKGVAQPWRHFISELRGRLYETFLRRMLNLRPDRSLLLTLEWRCGGPGCLLEPRYQTRGQLATHLFFFTPEMSWQRHWGGDVLILDDRGRCAARARPGLDSLPVSAVLAPRPNSSLLLQRTDHSWYGVRPLRCPGGEYFRFFAVTVWAASWWLWCRLMVGQTLGECRLLSRRLPQPEPATGTTLSVQVK